MTKARELGDNAQNTKPKVVDAKGDLIVGTGSDAANRLAAGSNGETLVADSSASTGLRWQADFSVGRNKILNSDFGIWQRGTSQNLTTSNAFFVADRWQGLVNFSAGTASISRQAFTPGTAPVAPYEGAFFHRLNTGTTATYLELTQKIEDVRTLAGQTITISFWAKANNNFTLKTLFRQNFGSGGSASVDQSSSFSVTTAWQRFTWTITSGSMSGKTIGSSSFLQLFFFQDTGALGGLDFDLWGVQVEGGSVATPFTTATGTLAGELAACQRYYYNATPGSGQFRHLGAGFYTSSTGIGFSIRYPVEMRVTPTLSAVTGSGYFTAYDGTADDAFDSVGTTTGLSAGAANMTGSTNVSGTQYRPCLVNTNNAAAQVAFSAEL